MKLAFCLRFFASDVTGRSLSVHVVYVKLAFCLLWVLTTELSRTSYLTATLNQN